MSHLELATASDSVARVGASKGGGVGIGVGMGNNSSQFLASDTVPGETTHHLFTNQNSSLLKQRGGRRDAGKLELVAIVHHETLADLVGRRNQQTQLGGRNCAQVNCEWGNHDDDRLTSVAGDLRDYGREKRQQQQQQQVDAKTHNTHEENASDGERKRNRQEISDRNQAVHLEHRRKQLQSNNDENKAPKKNRFISKLFTRTRKQTVTATTSTEITSNATALIDCHTDGSTSGKIDPNWARSSGAIVETSNNELNTWHHPAPNRADKQRVTCETAGQRNVQEQRQPIAGFDRDGKVIEFKLDLIVDGCSSGDNRRLAANANESAMLLWANEKLTKSINDSVESFVLDSQDVCLMSIGRRHVGWKQQMNKSKRETVNECSRPSANSSGDQERQQEFTNQVARNDDNCNGEDEEFEFMMSQLIRNTLAYSFELLNVSDGNGGQGNSVEGEEAMVTQRNALAARLDKEESSRSIEISARLLIGASEGQLEELIVGNGDGGDDDHRLRNPPTLTPGEISMVDLLAGEDNQAPEKGQQQMAVANQASECRNLDEALAVLARIRENLFRRKRCGVWGGDNELGNEKLRRKDREEEVSLILVSLKLRRRINGGLFSNRMSLIEFDPRFAQLEPIFEKIFNGQALAHLNRRKLEFERIQSSCSLIIQTIGPIEAEKHRHQVASLEKLIQAEWFLYKHLSSALIRALIIVNVHRLEIDRRLLAGDQGTELELLAASHQSQVMAHNMLLLQFACSLQRAANSRLRRRKRHLKNHLVLSNTSLASNASATTTTANIGVASAALFGSPHRTRRSSSLFRSQCNAHHLHGYNHCTCARSRKSSLDAGDLSSYHRSHRSQSRNHHTNNCSGYHSSSNRSRSCSRGNWSHCDRLTDAKLANWLATTDSDSPLKSAGNRAQKRHAKLLPLARDNNNQSDFTESSSMSTSSASGLASRQPLSSQPSYLQRVTSSRYVGLSVATENNGNLSPPNNYHNNLSDSDSVTSANLNSCSSPPPPPPPPVPLQAGELFAGLTYRQYKSLIKSRYIGELESNWLSKQSRCKAGQRLALQPHAATPSPVATGARQPREISSSASNGYETPPRSLSNSRIVTPIRDRNVVIQIDCEPRRAHKDSLDVGGSTCAIRTVDFGDDMSANDFGISMDDNLDDVSDIGSVVAQPPKQLKLEEFLSKLSKVIRADNSSENQTETTTNGSVDAQISPADLLRQLQVNNTTGNIDESSTLISGASDAHRNRHDDDDEDCKSHSSILDHLSSLALESNTKLSHRQQTGLGLQGESLKSDRQFPAINDNLDRHNVGHLQTLLNSPIKSKSTAQDEGSLGCIENRLKALTIDCQTRMMSPITTPISVFTSSNESSCDSSSTSSSSNVVDSMKEPDARNLYASVIRNRLNVKT